MMILHLTVKVLNVRCDEVVAASRNYSILTELPKSNPDSYLISWLYTPCKLHENLSEPSSIVVPRCSQLLRGISFTAGGGL